MICLSKWSFCLLCSHKSRVKGHLRLKMSYLPKNPGSEEEAADHTENVSLTMTFTGRHKHNSTNQAHFIYLE